MAITSTPRVVVSIALVKKRAAVGAERAQQVGDRVAGEVVRQHDAIVDGDAVEVDREFQRVDRVDHHAAAEVDRFSGVRSVAPSARACGLATGYVPASTGTNWPPISEKFVLTVEK